MAQPGPFEEVRPTIEGVRQALLWAARSGGVHLHPFVADLERPELVVRESTSAA